MVFPVWRSLCTIFGIVLAGGGAIVGFYIVPSRYHSTIEDSLKLVNNSDAFERWVNTPVPIQFKVYFFNVSNPDDVKEGKTPHVQEIGPYVYNQIRNKTDISSENDTLSYLQAQKFSFNAEASGDNKEDDIITIANLPLMSMATQAEKEGEREASFMESSLKKLFGDNHDIFITTTPKDFLFDGIIIACTNSTGGVSGRVCERIKNRETKQLEVLEDGRIKFSFLSFKNTTDTRPFKINSGLEQINLLGEIIEWNSSSELEMWNENGTCRNLHGCDSTLYPPFRSKESEINVFQTDICRVVNLNYKGESEFKGLSSLKFILPNNQFASGATVPENQCYCVGETKGITGEDGCLLDGAMELYSCLNVPVVFTFPHFLGAHEKYQNGVTGLQPNETLHRTFAELEPRSGMLLQGSKRAQFNIFYRPIKTKKKIYENNEKFESYADASSLG